MNKKIIAIILTLLVVLPCACAGLLMATSYVASADDPLQNALELLLILLFCLGPAGLLAGGLAWQISHNVRSRRVGQRLAGALGLTPLNAATSPMETWYGGVYEQRPLALKPCARLERSYAGGDYTTSARFWLRVVMAVQVPGPLGIAVMPGPGLRKGRVERAADAFQEASFARLPAEVQTAMLNFVQKGYPTGLSGVTLRTSKGARSLVLFDRAALPEWLPLAPEVLPAAMVVLVHDHQNTTLSAEQAQALLEDLAAVARAIEHAVRN